MRVAALLAAAAVAGCSEPQAPPNVVLVSIDTLRADHLGAYGYARPTSPAFDALARESVLFERAYTTASHTLPAHGSLLTGLYPETHGVLRDADSLAEAIPTLAERLKARGYRTGAFVNGGYLAPKFALGRGFDTYDFAHDWTRREVAGRVEIGRDAAATNRAVLEWLDAPGHLDGREPFFLFAHYFDPHSDWRDLPYESPPGIQEQFALARPPGYESGAGDVRASFHLSERMREGVRYGPAERAYLKSLYDGGVAYSDDQLGVLVAALRERDVWDRSLVIVVSDHGEEFEEHGMLLHHQIYEELVRVPLVISFPGGAFAGRRIAMPVGLVDVVPTVLDVLGIEHPGLAHGESLLSRVEGETAAAPETRPFFLRTQQGTQFGVVDGRWKLIVTQEPRETRLYDLVSDPGEQRDVSRREPAVVERLLARMADWTRATRAARPDPPPPTELSPELREALRRLGYTSD